LAAEHATTNPSSTPAPEDEASLARLEVRLDEVIFERDLARQTVKRLEREMRQMEHQVAQTRSEEVALHSRLDERERYIAVLHGSKGWMLLQGLRRVFGRRW
jgi:septal ring factor EnvC (AmiA/AmiB activator)